MDSQKIQEIIISTIEDIAKNTILNTNYLTLINGQISNVDKFNNFYNFTYQKEEYTGFSITGETYEVGDLVYVLKLNNDLTSKQMIISKVNSYTNFNIEMAINESLEEIKESISQIEAQDKEISIIGNTVFTLNDDLTITPDELTFSAQKSGNITDIVWYVDGAEYVQDNLKKITIPNSLVENKDSIIVRVQDLNNEEVYDEITVIRAMSSDTKLELDLGLDSILLQKNEQGVIDYSKAILTPKVLSDGEDVTNQGWEIAYKIENGDLTIIKEQSSYKILEMNSDSAKISFFAKKNGNMYLQKIIYITIVSYGKYNLNITASTQNIVIAKLSNGKIKENAYTVSIRATRGAKVLKVQQKENTSPSIGNVQAIVEEKDDNSLLYTWTLTKDTELSEINGNIKLIYIIENEEYNTDVLWTTVEDGSSGGEYRLDINPPNIIKNGDGTFTPSQIEINSIYKENNNDIPYKGYFKIYKTTNNEIYELEYEGVELESYKQYTLNDVNLKAIKIELLDNNKKILITEYCYVNINSDDFIEITNKTENNITELIKIDGQIKGLVEKDETIETTITNLETGTEQKFTEVNNKYSEVNQKIDSVTTTVSSHTEKLENIDGEIANQENRLTNAEQKLTADQWSLWFTEVVNNKTATSTKFTMDKNGLHIKGGGIDISNNAGSKVFYADSNGNLVINNLTANDGIFNGTINATSGIIGGWSIANSYLNSSAHNDSLNVDFVVKIDANLGTISFKSSNSTYTTNIGIDGIHFQTGRIDGGAGAGGDRWVYHDVVYGLEGISSSGNLSDDFFSLDTGGISFGTTTNPVGWSSDDGELKALGGGYLTNIKKINGYGIGGGNTGYNNTIIPVIDSSGVMEVSRYIDFHTERSQNYEARLNAGNNLLQVITNDFYSQANLHIGAPGTDLCNLELRGGSGSYARNAYIFLNDTGYIAIGQGDNYVDSTGGRLYLKPQNQVTYDMFVEPRNNKKTTLGSASKRFYRLYTGLSTDVSSDRRIKENFTEFDDRYIHLFELLKPNIYKLKNLSKEKSKVGGFIAQDVEDAMKQCGINKREFGIYKYNSEDDSYSLVYDMFLPLIVHYVQTKNNEYEIYKEESNKIIQSQQKEIGDLKSQLKNQKN